MTGAGDLQRDGTPGVSLPYLFEIALAQLGLAPAETLMVGDRASHDAGGVPLGITTLILPPAPSLWRRGLDAVLRLAGCH